MPSLFQVKTSQTRWNIPRKCATPHCGTCRIVPVRPRQLQVALVPVSSNQRWLAIPAVADLGSRRRRLFCECIMGQVCSCVEPRRRKLKRERRLSDASTQGIDHSLDEDDDGFSSSGDGDEIHIIIDGAIDERDALLTSSNTVMTKHTSKSSLLRTQTTTVVGAVSERSESDRVDAQDGNSVDPRSAVEQRRHMDVLRSYQKATGVVDPGQHELECVMCLDTFGSENPKVRTLCNCGMNRTNFHLSCLLEWLNRDANCPVCRQYLFYEEP